MLGAPDEEDLGPRGPFAKEHRHGSPLLVLRELPGRSRLEHTPNFG